MRLGWAKRIIYREPVVKCAEWNGREESVWLIIINCDAASYTEHVALASDHLTTCNRSGH